jgi:hypothetical protein
MQNCVMFDLLRYARPHDEVSSPPPPPARARHQDTLSHPRVIDGDFEDVVPILSNVPRLTLGRLMIGCRGAESVTVRLLRRVHSDSFVLRVDIQILRWRIHLSKRQALQSNGEISRISKFGCYLAVVLAVIRSNAVRKDEFEVSATDAVSENNPKSGQPDD